jgi:membrane-bound ClpP family serine protease
MVGLFVVGLTMMIVDGKFVQDGTMAAIGVLLMLVGLVMPTNDFLLGTGVACALILGLLSSLLSFRFLPKRDIWEKLTLRDRFTSEAGYSSINVTYQSLVGQKGRTLTDMRPSGTIEVGGKTYSAVTNGTWLKKGSPVKVESVNGTRIMVVEVKEG